tara:strand:- start:495 stop:1256 length:762 start_codon:yes stop_codon:yes gene_type:complete
MKKLGIIQSRGLGDIHIALPIAFFYKQRGYEIHWPIYEKWLDQMKHYVTWVNWIPLQLNSNEGHKFFYEEPLQILNEKKIDKIYCLYSFLNTKLDLSKELYFPFVSFDRFKYLKSEVPFYYKWKLSECIVRDHKREQIIYDKYVTNEKYVVTHLKASKHTADFDRSIIPSDHDLIEVSDDGYVLDWLKTIENAEMIIMTDSVMANIVDQLMIGKKKYFLQKNNIFFTPNLNSNWEWIENKNMDPKSIIMNLKK